MSSPPHTSQPGDTAVFAQHTHTQLHHTVTDPIHPFKGNTALGILDPELPPLPISPSPFPPPSLPPYVPLLLITPLPKPDSECYDYDLDCLANVARDFGLPVPRGGRSLVPGFGKLHPRDGASTQSTQLHPLPQTKQQQFQFKHPSFYLSIYSSPRDVHCTSPFKSNILNNLNIARIVNAAMS